MNGSIPPSAAFSAHGRAFIVHLECIQYKGSLDRVDLKMLLAVNQIANGGIAPIELTLQSILCHAAANLLRKISGEIFCKALQNRFFPLEQGEVDNLPGPRFCIGRIGGMLYLGLWTYEPTRVLNRERRNFYPLGGLPKRRMICYSKSTELCTRFHPTPTVKHSAFWGERAVLLYGGQKRRKEGQL